MESFRRRGLPSLEPFYQQEVRDGSGVDEIDSGMLAVARGRSCDGECGRLDRCTLSREPPRLRDGAARSEGQARLSARQPAVGADHDRESAAVVRLHERAVLSSTVAPGESTVIEAEMDTRNFVGPKATVLFVTLVTAGGREAEARLAVSSFILSDIVLNPGAIDFGTVRRGQPATQVLTIERINRPDWRFTRMVSATKSLSGQLVETGRNAGSVSYSLSLSVKPDAPVGLLRDEIRLISNDPETPSIPVMVSGVIRGDLTAAPSVLSLGQVHSSAGAQGRFVVRSSRPFAIRSIEGAGDGFMTSSPDGTRQSTHVVTVAYKPDLGTTSGDIRRIFRVHTDLPDEPSLDLTATLHVVP